MTRQEPTAEMDSHAESIRVVAPLDGDGVRLLISALALRRHWPDSRIQLTIVAPTSRSGFASRLQMLLEPRRVGVEIVLTRPTQFCWQDWRALLSGLAARDDGTVPVLDISAASPETAVRACDDAAFACASGFRVLSYEPRRGNAWMWASPRTRTTAVEQIAIDVGDANHVELGAVSASELLGLFDLHVGAEDPYRLGPAPDGSVGTLLLASAISVLAAFRTDENAYREFRRRLAAALRPGAAGAVLETVGLPATLGKAFDGLVDLGLACRNGEGRVVLRDEPERGAGFFLAGGWLEVLVAEALQRAFGCDRVVQRNAGAAWGDGDPRQVAYAEADAVFVKDNQLFVVSCKNEFVGERIFRHLDRLRALTAEFGEAHVRPVLLSTEPLEDRAILRCRAYEIAVLDGLRLLEALAADTASRSPGRLLRAITDGTAGTPGPGMGGSGQ
ncbi:MAG TPA: hypothetical protein PKJ41_10380 [Bryobacteraceae bacterium]|nr:hypothetical protein [Bryobacteraceae bacterium]